MAKGFSGLREHLAGIAHLLAAAAVLGWDQRVMMPPRGAEARARHQATLAKLSHEMLVSPQTDELLAQAEEEVRSGTCPPQAGLDASDLAAFLRVARRSYEKHTKVPTSLVVAITETTTLAEEVWVGARKANSYATFAPWLEKIYELKRQYAQAIGYQDRIYDALIDDYEEGMTARVLDGVFADLKAALVPMVAAIGKKSGRVNDEILNAECDEAAQERFSRKVLADCGFDFSRGRLDRAAHPFCTNFSTDDVRLTTRYDPHRFTESFYSCLHEMGHGLYEMNVRKAYEDTPLSGGVSLGVHESQSRLWENLVGRSRAFCTHYLPEVQKTFPAFGKVDAEAFYKAINTVRRSLIRTESDEVTYNLHVLLRYEMEQELLENRLSIADAPAAWNAKMQQYLGITPAEDRNGILQDVHWSGGGIGYFPTYTLGNVLAVQLFEATEKAVPGLESQIGRGEFGGLMGWLREHVHQHGSKYPPRELVQNATGRALTVAPYLAYLQKKFGDIYGL